MKQPHEQILIKLHLSLKGVMLGLIAIHLAATPLAAVASDTDLSDLELDSLLHVQVTSISKTPENLFGAAAAGYVITQEELHRSGITTIADALRTVPGMQVGSIDAHRWGISARGFNAELDSKLLVLIDGRSVYSPINAGVYWDVQDYALEDLDRIEVIRGPGASLWGANAVNGIINIISKSAKDTQGLLVKGGGGSEERGFGTVRYGGKLADDVYYRVYTKYFNRDDSVLPDGRDAGDAWWMARTGFRVDWDMSDQDALTLQGDLYKGREHQTRAYLTSTLLTVQTNNFSDCVAGGNILGRWSHTFSEDADLKVQLYYDRTERENVLPLEIRDTFDFDFQNRLQLGERNTVLWGAGCRVTTDKIHNAYDLMFSPGHRTDTVASGFLQDEIAVVPERLRLVLGSKFEHNDYTGFEFQPTARLAWTPTERQTLWTAVSHAVRTPSRAEDDLTLITPTPYPGINATILGSRAGVSERLMAYELGYRALPLECVSVDLAAYCNVYDRLRNLDPTAPFPPVFTSGNDLKGDTYGFEASIQWQVLPTWRLRGTYNYLHMNLQRQGGQDPVDVVGLIEGSSPEHQFSLRSSIDLTHKVQFDSTLRYVDELPYLSIPGYVTLDLRLAWQITRDLELSVVGLNLLDDRHPEFATTVFNDLRTEVPRSAYAQITWRF